MGGLCDYRVSSLALAKSLTISVQIICLVGQHQFFHPIYIWLPCLLTKKCIFLFCFSKLWLSVLMISTNHLSFRSSLTILRMVHQISQSHFLSLHHGPRKFQRLASFQYSDRFVDNTKLLLLVGFQLEVAILRAGVKPANSDHLINLVK